MPPMAPPVSNDAALDWLISNVKVWPVELDIYQPLDTPHGWHFAIDTDAGESGIVCRTVTGLSRYEITEDEWQEARPMVNPVVGQWYEIDGSAYQVKYVGTELVVMADVDGAEDVIGRDGMKGAEPCERPKTSSELILDDFNEWRNRSSGGTVMPLTIDDTNARIRLQQVIDFMLDRDGLE